MNAEIAKQWCAALRSGEFKQGRGFLSTLGGKDCCLGVLCKLAKRAGMPIIESHDEQLGGACISYNNEKLTLPRDVMRWAGIRQSDPLVKVGKGDPRPLTDINDSPDSSFEQIADIIEANVDKL